MYELLTPDLIGGWLEVCLFVILEASVDAPLAHMDIHAVITQRGDSALMIAASEGRTKVVSLLVKAGATLGQQQKKVSINL